MKKFALLAFVSCLMVSSAQAENLQIEIRDYQFSPKELTIHVGTQVTWVNRDQVPHTVVEKDKAFRSAALDTDEPYKKTFDKTGDYQYFCSLHSMMIGVIHVVK